MNPFQSLPDYENFVYNILNQFPSIQRSTLTVIQRHKYRAEVIGELYFAEEFHLSVYEHVTWERGSVTIEGYSYEGWRGVEKLYWYDSQPHPHNLALASTHPHHKHVPPDIKHNRTLAPDLKFTQPNLPFLIREMEDLVD